jgi:hypothetical protein
VQTTQILIKYSIFEIRVADHAIDIWTSLVSRKLHPFSALETIVYNNVEAQLAKEAKITKKVYMIGFWCHIHNTSFS